LGNQDEYDVRITANVYSNEVVVPVLSSFGITIEQVLPNTVQFRIPVLSPGEDRYKYIAFHTDEPVPKKAVRMDRKPFINQVAEYWLPILFVPFLLAFLETMVWRRNSGQRTSTESPWP
jgi:hypothetical protein